MKLKIITLLIIIGLFCNSCYLHERFKDDVQQGQILKKSQVDNIKVGMTKAEVVDILGSPVLEPIVEDRYDYVEWHRYRGEILKESIFTVYFNNNRVVRLDKSKYIAYQ